MSMRFPVKLSDDIEAMLQTAYAEQDGVVKLKGVPAQMKFQCTDCYMDHEGEDKHYLPVFHMSGYIKEVRGDFPYGTTSLYFDEGDKQELTKDLRYYPTPDEMVHLIQTGKFYTDRFQLPSILKQEYELPCTVDLTIVPPIDEVTYEGSLSSDINELSDDAQSNLPIFYAKVTGTGVSKENDETLRYYGIDLDKTYENFYLTAESSGYTEPTLMQYVTEPPMKKEIQSEMGKDYYLSEEESRQMRREAQMREQQAQDEVVQEAEKGAQAEVAQVSEFDMEVAEAARNVGRRLEERFGGQRMSAKALRETDIQRAQSDKLEERDQRQQYLENEMDFNPDRNEYVDNDADESKKQLDDEPIEEQDSFDVENKEGGDAIDIDDQKKIDEAHTRDMARETAEAQQNRVVAENNDDKLGERDVPQQATEVKMDLDMEHNKYVEDKRNEEKSVHEIVKEISERDEHDNEKLEGADVSDIDDQKKVDEAKTRAKAKDTAVKTQTTLHEISDTRSDYDDDYSFD